jgi:hypothetical protein
LTALASSDSRERVAARPGMAAGAFEREAARAVVPAIVLLVRF